MSPVIFFQRQPFPSLIRKLRGLVLWTTAIYAIWYELFTANYAIPSPDLLLLSSRIDLSIILKPWTAALTLPYQGFTWSMLFDLVLLNFFLCPIYSFVHSFLTSPNFFRFLFALVVVTTMSFCCSALFLFPSTTLPTSLFGSISFGVVVFWALLHNKGQSSFLTIIPVQPMWAVITAACVVLIPAVLIGDWTKCVIASTAGLYSYLFAVCRWRLRSHVPMLSAFEQQLDDTYRLLIRTYEWRIAKPIRQIVEKLRKSYK